jgi:hypothetical protein
MWGRPGIPRMVGRSWFPDGAALGGCKSVGTEDEDHQILLRAIRQIRSKLVAEVEKVDGETTLDDALSAAVLAAVVNMESIDELARESRRLVKLTRALFWVTVVLSILTAALLIRTLG